MANDLRERAPILKHYSSYSDSEKDSEKHLPRRCYEPVQQQRRQLLEQLTALEHQQAQLMQQVGHLEQQLGEQGNQLGEQDDQIQRLKRYSLCGVKLGWLLVVCFAVLAVMGSLGLSGYQQYELIRQQNNLNVVYERIGAKNCPENIGTTEIYSGITVGFVSEKGSTAFQCMPNNSDFVRYYENSTDNDTKFSSFAHTTKYETFITEKNGTHAACAKCSAQGRSSVELLPSTHSCQPPWTKEYSGYLMTDGGSTGFVCVDRHMESVEDGHNSHNPTLKHVITKLHYDGYQPNKVLSCVVCSK